MSAYSDWHVGAISDEEYTMEANREARYDDFFEDSKYDDFPEDDFDSCE